MRSEARKYAGPIAVAHLVLLFLVVWMYVLPAQSLVRSWQLFQVASLYVPTAEDLLHLYGEDLQALSPSFAFNYALSLLGSTGVGILLLGVLGGHIIGSEFRWRTLGGQIACVQRRRFLAGKIALLGATALSLCLCLAALAAIASRLVQPYLARHLPLAGLTVPAVEVLSFPIQLLITWLSLMLFVGLAFVFVLLTRVTISGLVLYLAFWFGQLQLAFYLGHSPIIWLSPTVMQQSLALRTYTYLSGSAIVTEPDIDLVLRAIPSSAMAAAMVVVFIALVMLLAVVVFDRQEVR